MARTKGAKNVSTMVKELQAAGVAVADPKDRKAVKAAYATLRSATLTAEPPTVTVA